MVELYDIDRGQDFFFDKNAYDIAEEHADYVLNCTSANISAEWQGVYTFTAAMPLTEYMQNDKPIIYISSILKVDSFIVDNINGSTNKSQLYSVYDITVDNYTVTIKAEPILYRSWRQCYLRDVRPTNKNNVDAYDYMYKNSLPGFSHTLQPLIYDGYGGNTATAYYNNQTMLEAINGTGDNNFKDRWQSVIIPDNNVAHIFDIKTDYNMRLYDIKTFAYGLNLCGLKAQYDGAGVARFIVPKGYNGIQVSEYASGVGQQNGGFYAPNLAGFETWNDKSSFCPAKCVTFDYVRMASDIEQGTDTTGMIICNNQTDVDNALANETKKLYNSRQAGIWNFTLDIDFVELRDNIELSEEDKSLFNESVRLGDCVNVYSKSHGVEILTRCIGVEWDCLAKKTTKVKLSNNEYEFMRLVNMGLNTSGLIYKTRRV